MSTIDISGNQLQLPAPRNAGAAAILGEGRQERERLQRLISLAPPTVDREQLLVAIALELNKLPVKVDPRSAVMAAFNCVTVGLLPGKPLNHAFFIPFGGEVVLVFGYEGYLHLAYQSGFLARATVEVVLRDEPYRRWNNATGPQIEHELPIDRDEAWDNVLGAYCLWHSTAPSVGGKPFGDVTVVPRQELEGIRKAAIAKARGKQCVWQTNPIAMCKKTPVRRASKLWMKAGRAGWQLSRAVHLDELADRGEPQTLMPDAEEAVEEADAEVNVSVDEYGNNPMEGDATKAAEPFVLKLQKATDLEQTYGEVTADPAFEALPMDARTLIHAEHSQLRAKAEGKLFS